jgi:hypothetical protein
MRKKPCFCISSFLCLAIAPLLAIASPTEQGARAYGGTIVCGGNHFTRLDGTEIHTTSYAWRNYDPSISIRINRVRIYDATGAILKDYGPGSLPTSFNGVMPFGDNTLEPFQSALYRTSELLDAPLTLDKRPIQVHIDWAAHSWVARIKALVPEFVWVRVSRHREHVGVDSSGAPIYKVREERARHLNNCRLTKSSGLEP